MKKRQKFGKNNKRSREKEFAKLKEEVANKTSPSDTIPLVDLFSSQESQNPEMKGLSFGDQVILFSPKDPAPKSIFLKKSSNEGEVEEYSLVTPSSPLKSPVIYSKQSPNLLKTKRLPQFGHYDLQLVFLPQKPEEKTQIVFARFNDSTVSVPLMRLHDEFKVPLSQSFPSGDAVALLKVDDNWTPVGIYNPKKNSFLRLDEIQSLTAHLDFGEKAEVSSKTSKEEKFYQLGTSFQQLVFSNHGGALAEINLPFRSQENSLSVVKEIGFDREMVRNQPQNAQFPANPFFTPPTTSQEKPEWHTEGNPGGHYPLLRRDLIERPPHKSVKIDPRYYALNLVSDYPRALRACL